jgi:hypothetical protein
VWGDLSGESPNDDCQTIAKRSPNDCQNQGVYSLVFLPEDAGAVPVAHALRALIAPAVDPRVLAQIRELTPARHRVRLTRRPLLTQSAVRLSVQSLLGIRAGWSGRGGIIVGSTSFGARFINSGSFASGLGSGGGAMTSSGMCVHPGTLSPGGRGAPGGRCSYLVMSGLTVLPMNSTVGLRG